MTFAVRLLASQTLRLNILTVIFVTLKIKKKQQLIFPLFLSSLRNYSMVAQKLEFMARHLEQLRKNNSLFLRLGLFLQTGLSMSSLRSPHDKGSWSSRILVLKFQGRLNTQMICMYSVWFNTIVGH